MSSDKNRLIELISGLPFSAEYEKYNSLEFAEHLADHLLANGIIAPPCKVGDTVYFIERHPERLGGTKINTAEVLSIKANISHKGMTFWLFITYQGINGTDTCGEVLYGRTAFKTKEEAEQALAERSGDNA